jgi:protein-disulfide isomerase/uncharacterized membrane protein
LAGVLVWLHAKLASAGTGYTSFCNVNSSINCDLVLNSPFAKLFGVPIAWLALGANLALAATFQAAARSEGARARLAVQLACAGAIGAAAFSAYMAFVSLVFLKTICLMCTGLYVVSIALLVIALMLPSRFARAGGAAGKPPLTARAMGALGVGAILAVAGLAGAAWRNPGPKDRTLSLEQLRQADHEFYDWYVALPVGPSPLGSARHVLGAESAPITIVEFSDFECAFCARNHAILKELVARQPDLVRVVYRHFPLDAACNDALEKSVHARACRAAEAAECAGRQGRFHEMADALFANQRRLFENNLFELAEGLRIDAQEFRSCMDEHAARDDISADARDGKRLDIRSTPTLFINGRKVTGTLPDLDRYEHAVLIEDRLDESKGRGQG